MSSQAITELLAKHADKLNQQEKINIDDFIATVPEQRSELAALLDIASRLKQTLRPLKPAREFRARLRNGLLLASHHRETHQLLVHKPAGSSWGWLVRAAALGSAAGLIALILRLRQNSSAPIASPESIH